MTASAETPMSTPTPRTPRALFTLRRLLAFAALGMLVILARPAMDHVKAAELLVRFADPSKAAPATVSEREEVLATPGGGVRARFYAPAGRDSAPVVVLVQGMHRKGIDEPRLQRFARSVSDVGYEVVTPEVRDLSDYRIDTRSIDTVGATVDALSRGGKRKVGVMGMSFGGGIALLTAADPRFAERVSFVVAVGAHDDLPRVTRFFMTQEIKDPDGKVFPVKPHAYGAMVVVRSHVDRFFPPGDAAIAGEAMKLQLWEDPAGARELAKKLPPASKAKLDKMLDGDFSEVKEEVLSMIEVEQESMKKVSPAGHMGGLRAPAFLLHGEKDTVVPASETMFLAREIPEGRLGGVVVSSAIRHVEIEGEPTLAQKWELVHWMGEVLGTAG